MRNWPVLLLIAAGGACLLWPTADATTRRVLWAWSELVEYDGTRPTPRLTTSNDLFDAFGEYQRYVYHREAGCLDPDVGLRLGQLIDERLGWEAEPADLTPETRAHYVAIVRQVARGH